MHPLFRVAAITGGLLVAGVGALAAGVVPGMGDTCCPARGTAAVDAVASEVYDAAMTAGCQKACAFHGEVREGEVVPQAEAEVGDLTRCPVSGVAFEVKEGQPTVEIDGQTLYTCCETCAERARASHG